MASEVADGERSVRPQKLREVTTSGSPLLRALADLWSGLWMYSIWGTLAWSDIRRRYKRSKFGALWITLSMAIFIAMLGVLYAGLFHRELSDYIPHLTVGYILWGVISTFVGNGPRCFIQAEGIIKQLFAPLSVHAYRMVWSTFITLAHHAVIFVVVAIIFNIRPTEQWLLAAPGLALIFLSGTWVVIFLGMLCARFRDVPQVLQSVTRVMFFLTPVIWQADLMPARAVFLTANPFYHFIEIVRAPLLNKPIDPLHWQVAGAVTVIGWIVTIAVYQRFRQRVPYWL